MKLFWIPHANGFGSAESLGIDPNTTEGQEFANKYGMEIEDIDKMYATARANGKIIVDVDGVPTAVDDPITPEQRAAMEQAEQRTQRMAELEQWFVWYDIQVMQYQRCIRLSQDFDKDINLLDMQAHANAAELKQLRNQVA